jgi:probable rRNA maturation factor
MPIILTAHLGRRFVPTLRRQLKRAVALVSNAPAEISVALVNDRTMSDLHMRHMGLSGPTDVLTFELDHDATGRCIAGEVVVCVPQAVRRARQEGSSVPNELLLYSLHGVLHLAGFDDRTAKCFAIMHTMEDDILTQIGVGPVFNPARRSISTTPRKRTRGARS